MADLTEKPIGFTGTIIEISESAVNVSMTSRLREIGFTKGEELKIVGIAPFGEPFLIELRGAIVALRKKEAQCIQV